MTIIVYSSKSGSSEKYAKALSEATGFKTFSVHEDYPTDEMIILFGWLRKDTIVGINGVDRSKIKAACVVGLDGAEAFNSKKVSEKNDVKAPLYYLRGWIDRTRLGLIDKAILMIVCVMMKLKGLNQFTTPLFDAMMNGGSFYDESMLESVIRFCKNE